MEQCGCCVKLADVCLSVALKIAVQTRHFFRALKVPIMIFDATKATNLLFIAQTFSVQTITDFGVINNLIRLYKTQNMTLLKLQRDESDSRSKTQAVSLPR